MSCLDGSIWTILYTYVVQVCNTLWCACLSRACVCVTVCVVTCSGHWGRVRYTILCAFWCCKPPLRYPRMQECADWRRSSWQWFWRRGAVFDVYRLQVIQVPSWTPKVWWLIRCLGSFQYCMFTCWCGDFSSFRVCSSLLNSSLYSALTPAVELGKNHCCAICVLGVGLFWAIQINEDNQHIFSKTPARDTHEIDI